MMYLLQEYKKHDNALDIGPETGMMLSTYIVEVGEPLATFTR